MKKSTFAVSFLAISCAAVLLVWPGSVSAAEVPDSTAPAVYAAGNIGNLEAGSNGSILLTDEYAAFTPLGGTPVRASYKEIRNIELGAKLLPKKDKIWKMRLNNQKIPHRFLTIEFMGPKDEIAQNMTLVLSEGAATQVQNAIELKTGKKTRATMASYWWGDSMWKTNRNGNVVSPVSVGGQPANQ
jgi:hypothetical protein